MNPRRLVLSVACTLGPAFAATLGCKIEPVRDMPAQTDVDRPDTRVEIYPDQRVVDEESSLVEAELRRQLSLLTSPYLAGRRPGSEGATLTAGHIERSMRQMGLAPAGVGGGWRQPVVVRVRSTEDGRLELPSAVADSEPEVLRHGEDIVLWRSVEGAGPWTEDVALVDLGYGIEAPELAHDDYEGVDVRGKIVLVHAGVPADESFDDDATARYGALEYKLAHAERKGALGCLVATGSLQREAAWSQTLARHSGPHVDQPVTDGPSTSPPLVGMVSAEAEARLRAWLTASTAGPEAGAGGNEAGAPAKPVRVAVTTSEQTIVDASIVGRIPGRDQPREVIVLLAHWDAGGLAPPLPEGGALADNATGVAALLTVARRSAEWSRRGRAPSRSIAFVATASDTLGIAGARALLDDGPLSRSDIVAVISLDELSTHAEAPPLGAVDLGASELADVLSAVRPSIRPVAPEQAPHMLLGHTPALTAGIAAVTLTQHDPEATPAETFDSGEVVDPLVDNVVFVFDVAWRLAESARIPAVTPRAEAPSEDAKVEPPPGPPSPAP